MSGLNSTLCEHPSYRKHQSDVKIRKHKGKEIGRRKLKA